MKYRENNASRLFRKTPIIVLVLSFLLGIPILLFTCLVITLIIFAYKPILFPIFLFVGFGVFLYFTIWLIKPVKENNNFTSSTRVGSQTNAKSVKEE